MAQVSTMSHFLFMVGIGKGVEKVSEVTMIIFSVQVHLMRIYKEMSVLAYLMTYYTANLHDFNVINLFTYDRNILVVCTSLFISSSILQQNLESTWLSPARPKHCK